PPAVVSGSWVQILAGASSEIFRQRTSPACESNANDFVNRKADMAGAFIVARELRRTPGNQAQGSEGKVNRSGALLAMLHAHYASCILQLPAPYGRPAMG